MRTVAAALGVICGQLGTLGLFLEFARIPLADQSNNSWIIWATFMTCIASFVVLSAGLLRSAWRPAKPRTQSIRLLLVPMAIYATSWSILSSQALRIDTFLMLDQISWALLFCLSLTSLLPLPNHLGALAVSQHALQCGMLMCLHLVADNGHSALGLQLTGLMGLLCAVSHLSVKRANARLSMDRLAQEQHSQLLHLHEVHIAQARLCAMVSHDLRQPVHALGLMLERIQQTAPEFSERVDVDAVSDVTHSLTHSLGMLMDATRLNSGEIVALPDAVSLEQLFISLNHEFKDTAHRNSLHLVFDHGHLDALTDPHVLRTILSNLISNSIKYSLKGSISIRARLKDDEWISIDVADEGKGIAKQDLPRIFEPFVKLQLRSTEEDGVGLGLTIVKQMADLIKAPLSITSKIGVGTTFSIELPRTEPATRTESLASQVQFRELQVVVVDNDRMVLDNTVQTLEEWGCRVIAAHDWPELECRLGRTAGRIDLILCDFHLDGAVSGCDLIIKLRDWQKAEIPSILLTGDVDVRHAPEGPAHSVAIAYKPLPSRKLAMLIHEMTTATVTSHRRSPPGGSPETTKPSFPRASMTSKCLI